jgi:hypothetical protein
MEENAYRRQLEQDVKALRYTLAGPVPRAPLHQILASPPHLIRLLTSP